MLRRYGNIEYILSMDIATFCEFVRMADEKQREEKLFHQWSAQLPVMQLLGKEGYVSFEEYYDKLTGKSLDMRSTEEISAEIEAVEKAFQRQVK